MFSGISALITCYDNKYLTPDIMHSDYDQLYYVCMSPSTQKIRLEALFWVVCPSVHTCMHTQTKAFSYHLAANIQLFYISGMHLKKFTKMHDRAVEYFCVLKCYVAYSLVANL